MDWIRPVRFSSLVLTLFALATGAMIAGTYLSTKDRIAQQERIAQAKALLEILPQHTHDNLMVDDSLPVTDTDLLHLGETSAIYLARQQGKVIGMIIPAVAPDGYSGNINIITGLYRNGEVAGVRVVSHNETPGLGDKADVKKSPWVLGFNGKSLLNPSLDRWRVKKDKGEFDQFTGATITPRAITKAVLKTLQYYEQNSIRLLAEAETTTPAATITGANDE